MHPAEMFQMSERAKETLARVTDFVERRIAPVEKSFFEAVSRDRWTPPALLDAVKAEARAEGLWNLFLPESAHGAGFTNLEYAPMAESMGGIAFAAEVFNCSAPDTGNMEVLARYGTPEQQKRWLRPLLEGTLRSGFAMTEPEVASSDATNLQGRITRDGDHYVIDARKWWTSGAGDPRCGLLLFLGRSGDDTAERHRRHTLVLVPMDAPGVRVERLLPVFGFDDAPHGHAEISFTGVRVPVENVVLGEGRGFEIAQGRLGPGRIHHCMRLIGLAARALGAMCRRLKSRVAFGKTLAEQSVWRERVANARVSIDQTRLLVLHAAHRMDTVGNKNARAEIAMIKIAAPTMACEVIDMAIQAHGAAGLCDDHGLSWAYANARMLRIADGPDEVHRDQLARLELERH